MEDLLTLKEIQNILDDSQKKEYSNDKVYHLGKNKTSIILHSKKSGLILVKGNEDTGYEHIFNRHSLLSRIPFLDKYGNIEKQSKFRIETIPIEYLTIANTIFKKENLNIKENKLPKKFDLYDGSFTHFDLKEVEYRLITYKDTGIIHTFFIKSKNKPFNPKKILNLRKGWTSAIDRPSLGIQDFTFSYFDSNNSEKAKVLVECDTIKKTEKWSIEVCNEEGHFISKKNVKTNNYTEMGIQDRINKFDLGDTSWVEKEIKLILNK